MATSSIYPVFKIGKLRLDELVDICVSKNINDKLLARTVPWNIFKSVVYVLDTSVVNNRDISTDGIIYDEHSSPSENICVTFDENNAVTQIERNKNSSKNANTDHIVQKFKIKRHYSKVCSAGHVLQRTIVRFFDANGEQLVYVPIIYVLDGHLKGSKNRPLQSNPFKRPHGNSRKSTDSYSRTNPSVMNRIEYLGQHKRPKQIITAIENDAGGVFAASTPSQLPRDSAQIYNKLKLIPDHVKCRNTGKTRLTEYTKLIAMSLNGGFVKDASLHPRKVKGGTFQSILRTFCTTDLLMKWTTMFCSPLKENVHPAQIDMTYKCGPFYATTMIFHHPMFVRKNTEEHPGIFIWLGTSNTKETGDYSYFAHQLKQQNVNAIVFGSDGETAMEAGFEQVFPIEGITTNKRSLHLRCSTHFQCDIERFCNGNGLFSVEARELSHEILGAENNGVRIRGLIDAENDEIFEWHYTAAEAKWPKLFKEWMMSKVGKVRSNKEMLKLCLLAPVRTAAGLGRFF